MKLIILQEKLKQGLALVDRLSGKTTTLPVLNSVLLDTQKNFLCLSTTDLEIGIKWWVLAKVEREGKIAVPCRVLNNFISLLSLNQILLEGKNNILEIKSGNFQTQIKGLSAEEFPPLPSISKENYVEIEALSFCQALNQVVDIAFPSQARPEISGIFFSFQKDTLVLAATDSFRLGEKTIFLEKTFFPEKEISFILPQKTAREIINIFSQLNRKLKIYFSPHHLLFETEMLETPHPQVQLVSRLIEGDYPAYQEIIPKKFQTQIILTQNEFLNQLKIASLFSSKINEVKIKTNLKKGGIEILSRNPDLGEHCSFLPAKIKGEPLEISFNHRFLIDGLLKIKSAEVLLELSGEEGPAVLKPVGDSTYFYVVMPIKAS